MEKGMEKLVKGWVMLSVGALMISAAAGVAWSLPAALAVAGAWVIVYGIDSERGIRRVAQVGDRSATET